MKIGLLVCVSLNASPTILNLDLLYLSEVMHTLVFEIIFI